MSQNRLGASGIMSVYSHGLMGRDKGRCFWRCGIKLRTDGKPTFMPTVNNTSSSLKWPCFFQGDLATRIQYRVSLQGDWKHKSSVIWVLQCAMTTRQGGFYPYLFCLFVFPAATVVGALEYMLSQLRWTVFAHIWSYMHVQYNTDQGCRSACS